MKKLFAFLVGCNVIFSACAQDSGAAIDTLIGAYSRINKFNGVALVVRQGNILLSKGYGFRNVEQGLPNTEKSIVMIGSVTKQFTAAVILKLQAEGKLATTDKLTKYFPGYPKGDSISIQHLLTHTSGIYSYTGNRDFMKNEITKPQTREKMMVLFKDKPLDFSPGSGWNYSNSGYSLLGYIIEIVTHQSYEAAVYKYIFAPLKMHSTGFDFTHLKSHDKTTGYFVANRSDTLPAPVVDSSVSFSAGAIYSTVGDMYKWHMALQSNSILSSAQQEIAYTPVRNGYGYGWMIDSIEGKRRVGHTGGTPGYISIQSRVPEDDICIMLFSNASDKSLKDIMKSIYAILYEKKYSLPVEKKSILLPASILRQYEGEYELAESLNLEVRVKGNGLGIRPTGDSEKILLPEKEDVFFENQDDVQVTFTRDEQKRITGLILQQSGRQINCNKIR